MICLMLTIFAHIFPSAWTGINERTFLAIKPDGCQRRLVGEIIQRFEKKGFKLVAMKMMQASEALLKEHYFDLRDRPFYQRLVKYMGSGPVIAMMSAGMSYMAVTPQRVLSARSPCGLRMTSWSAGITALRAGFMSNLLRNREI
ncbi:hypothetical protein AB205_0165950 [Aquarana catesbeiana]|uniref:nucleoside-diphosphate kinase n=1 Tax=Aquarana catesbeiana TaxID=8400 RepID=A0A2G9RY19_AQUCT|nr:hypothetical protein AB205_0165950 [Aquarana catesbeiana]